MSESGPGRLTLQVRRTDGARDGGVMVRVAASATLDFIEPVELLTEIFAPVGETVVNLAGGEVPRFIRLGYVNPEEEITYVIGARFDD